MQFSSTGSGFTVQTTSYRAAFSALPAPRVRVYRENRPMLDLAAVSGLATVQQEEDLTDVRVVETSRADGEVRLTLAARSSLWPERLFHWTFCEDRVEHYHEAKGPCRPGRCYFFSNGTARMGPAAAACESVIHARRSFSPAANMADEYERMLGIPLSLGILPEVETPFAYGVPDRTAMIFAPPPLCVMFGRHDQWAGIGLGTQPGQYQFNAFEYAVTRGHGAAFFVNYLGYHAVTDFTSPRVAIQFGYSPYQVLEQHVAWTDAQGYSTRHRFENAPWHRLPVFCGWGEQCCVAGRKGCAARDEATQANYEQWVQVLEQRRLPFHTIVIDDKWQAAYGTFDVDTQKWPDMAAFVAQQHQKRRHVLLWVPVYHQEGVPNELCVMDGAKRVCADVSHPAYEQYLREKLRYLVRDVGIDGFKVDWVWGITRKPETKTHAPLHGIEWLRRFQHILYDETHRWRPDALVETHSANPLFRESSDVLRLNDLHGAARNIVRAMALRARIAQIAGWPVKDCDSASGTLEEWWSYMQAQPVVGTPSLYLVTGSGNLEVPAWMWEALAAEWREYCEGIA